MKNVVIRGRDYITVNEFTFLRKSVFSLGVARTAPEGSEQQVVVCQVYLNRPDGRIDKVSLRDQSSDPVEQAVETVNIYINLLAVLEEYPESRRQALETSLLNSLEVPVDE